MGMDRRKTLNVPLSKQSDSNALHSMVKCASCRWTNEQPKPITKLQEADYNWNEQLELATEFIPMSSGPHLLSPTDLDTYRGKHGIITFNSNKQLQLEQGITIVTDSIPISSGPHAGPLLISPTNLDTYAMASGME